MEIEHITNIIKEKTGIVIKLRAEYREIIKRKPDKELSENELESFEKTKKHDIDNNLKKGRALVLEIEKLEEELKLYWGIE